MKDSCESYLREQFGDDADVIGEIYGEYVSSRGEKIGEADSALAASEWDRLDKVAHTVKGNALATGDGEMAEAAIALRKAAVLCDAAQSGALIARMKEIAAAL